MAQVQPWRDVPRQDGRRFVVTGASSGIGLETAKALAAAGAEVVLAVRNLDKGKAAAGLMSGDVEVALLDVADLSSVRAFADDVGPVDVLVNNAGVLGLPFGLSPDGVELHLATNHLGHFALANLLLPRLTDRVVVVGSASHRSGELDARRPAVGAAPATARSRRTAPRSWRTCCSSPSCSAASPRPGRPCG